MTIPKVLPALSALLLASACSDRAPTIRDFSSDGCTLFPDASYISSDDWCECCFEHDLAYWRGGTREERETADRKLQQCVQDRTGNAVLAELMYEGVRLGGSPYFYNWYRWGYGWDFERKYQPLSAAEKRAADEKLQRYYASEDLPLCGSSRNQ